MLTCSVPLCEKCANNDWERMGDIKTVYRMAAVPEPKHIWCKATDRPEDMRWNHCEGFRAMGHGRH